jgi:hypothetical protein
LPLLKAAPGLRPIGIFDELLRRHPGLLPGFSRECGEPWSDASGPGGR